MFLFCIGGPLQGGRGGGVGVARGGSNCIIVFKYFFLSFFFLLRRPPSHGHSFLNIIFSILCSEKNKQSFELNQKLLIVLDYEHFYALNSCFSSRFLLLLEM